MTEINKTGAEIQKERRRIRIEEYNKNPKKCKHCSKTIDYDKKRTNTFCNHSCAASFNNKGIRRNFTTGNYVVKNSVTTSCRKIKCLNCNSDTENVKFCCFECSVKYKKKERLKNIIKYNKIYSSKDKQYIIEMRGNKCEICGNTEWLSKPILLILDHIDGNSDNNSLDNIQLICSNCDATLPTYKSKNKNNGRDTRRQQYRKNRYKNGSCN